MTFFASVAGHQVVSGSLLIPLVGTWTADLHLATDQPVAGAVTVVLGNLTLHGAVVRSQAYGGQTRARLVGGYGGWRSTVPDQGYGSGSGVKLSHVLGDVASACGERVNVAADRSVGAAYTRADGPASDVLWNLVAQGVIPAWRVDTAGVTQVTAWPATTVGTPFTVTDQRPDEGLVVVATEDYAAWLPGCSFTAPQLAGSLTNAGVNYVFDNDGTFRLEVLTGTADRLLGALNAIIARKVAPTRFYGRYEYRISNPSETTIDGTPTDDAIGLPDLQGVPIEADSIALYVPPDDGLCHVMFVNGDPSRPSCVWTEGNPTIAQLLSGTNPAAKLGDTVQSMISGSVQILGGTLALTGVSVGACSPVVVSGNMIMQGLSPISGTITTGSSTVEVPL